jgi:hypothetical protein
MTITLTNTRKKGAHIEKTPLKSYKRYCDIYFSNGSPGSCHFYDLGLVGLSRYRHAVGPVLQGDLEVCQTHGKGLLVQVRSVYIPTRLKSLQ